MSDNPLLSLGASEPLATYLDKRLDDLEDAVGEGGGEAVTWTNLSGKPAVIAAGADQAAARNAIGAGTGNSNLTLGSSASQAAAGNHTHPAASGTVAGFMSAADKAKLDGVAAGATALAIGTGATQAAAGNHTHTQYATTQALADLVARVAALEAAGAA